MQCNSHQLTSTQLNSHQLNSTQLNSHLFTFKFKAPHSPTPPTRQPLPKIETRKSKIEPHIPNVSRSRDLDIHSISSHLIPSLHITSLHFTATCASITSRLKVRFVLNRHSTSSRSFAPCSFERGCKVSFDVVPTLSPRRSSSARAHATPQYVHTCMRLRIPAYLQVIPPLEKHTPNKEKPASVQIDIFSSVTPLGKRRPAIHMEARQCQINPRRERRRHLSYCFSSHPISVSTAPGRDH